VCSKVASPGAGAATVVTRTRDLTKYLAGSYSTIDIEFGSGTGISALSVPIDGPVPGHLAHVRGSVNLSGGLEATTLFYGTSAIPDLQIPSVNRLDFRLAWTRGNVGLAGGVQNLTGSYGVLRLAQPARSLADDWTSSWDVPRHRAHVRTGWRLRRSVEVIAELFRVAKVGETGLDPYTKLDVRYEHEIGRRVEASLSGRNLFHGGDREFYDTARRSVVPVRTTGFAELEWQF
jgi:hypothetical protein